MSRTPMTILMTITTHRQSPKPLSGEISLNDE